MSALTCSILVLYPRIPSINCVSLVNIWNIHLRTARFAFYIPKFAKLIFYMSHLWNTATKRASFEFFLFHVCFILFYFSKHHSYAIIIIERMIEMKTWINKKDQLPEAGKSVLISDGHNIFIGYYDSDHHLFETELGNCVSATHWMPLPKLP